MSWEMPYGVRISVHPPRIDPEPLLWPEHPWESWINAYSALFVDERRYRYRARQQIDGSWSDVEGPWVLTSRDNDLTWDEQPTLVDSTHCLAQGPLAESKRLVEELMSQAVGSVLVGPNHLAFWIDPETVRNHLTVTRRLR